MRDVVCAGVLCLLSGVTSAADYRVSPDDYREQIKHLQPGDRLLLEPGDYRRGLPLHNLSGRIDQPIIVEAANPLVPPRFIARPEVNTISLINVRYLVLRHLELDGRNVRVDAIKAEGHSGYADFITLEHLFIHDHAASQQNVGISSKCPALGWIVRKNRIERVGTGIYFGDSDGSDPFVGGLIEANHVSHTLGYNLQIKHQKTRPPDIAGRHDTIIRYNVFSKQDTVPGPQARPNVLLGHFPLAGVGSEDRYLVYGNLFLSNPTEALLQAEGRVALYDNVFINDSGDAIHIQPHNDVPRDTVIFSNTVLVSGTGIQVRSGESTAYRQYVVANVVAASMPLHGGEETHNVTLAYRRDLVSIPVADLTVRLLGYDAVTRDLPFGLMREFSAYPGWQVRGRPGAKPPLALLHTLEAVQP
ncbi:MAG: hypothetical protein Q8K52_05155 [Thiobacillus sp.]|nr:hypothetical protein [Thiobacillus sp.]